eukprot:12563542-Alexandrium_andersonii.AAC.1
MGLPIGILAVIQTRDRGPLSELASTNKLNDRFGVQTYDLWEQPVPRIAAMEILAPGTSNHG